ncbi:hypothetical protein BP6252_12624 [Coleophoma cylindrospora]|uniref:Uncharacterized protein n=1 Tax=Coleophoma cylindrospora TaxID=1849047 RepID=A0A3D8QCU3_9HELO|nr:hypothetical protein BP6252_12624 [Coleophoma cylindrospora]
MAYKLLPKPESTHSPCSASWSNIRLEPTKKKVLLFIPCIFTTIVNLLLVTTIVNDWTIQGTYYDRINRDRASVQILVHILAGLLGLAQVSTLRNLVNYYARDMLFQHKLTLDELGFYNALTTSQINWALPKLRLFVLLITAAVALGPSALWTGALTPINVIAVNKEHVSLFVPTYSNHTADYWQQGWFNANVPPKHTNLGMFTYAPQRERYNFFINDGSTASSLDGRPQVFKKGDNSNFTYHGRSYGMGSSVGLVDKGLTIHQHIIAYSYFETGYQSNFTCTRNISSASTFLPRFFYLDTNAPMVYLFRSASPIDSTIDSGYFVADLSTGQNITAAKTFSTNDTAGWLANSTKPLVYLDIQGLGAYEDLKGIQCMGQFIPTKFSVDVDVVNQTITVTPNTAQGVVNIDESGAIAGAAGDSLAALSLISTNSFTSVLGNMFHDNIFNVKQQGTNETDETLLLRGIGESVQAISDQYFFSLSSAQLMIANDTRSEPVIASIRAIRVGKDSLIYAVTTLNCLVVLILIFQAVWTKLWYGLLKFNFADVKNVIVGTSQGGGQIAQIVEDEYKIQGSIWSGEASDRVAGNIPVHIVQKAGTLAVVAILEG